METGNQSNFLSFMSSYLNIYVKKEEQDKPVLICSYSRNSDIYQGIYESINPAWAGDKEVYTELYSNDINKIIEEIKETILSINKSISAYKEMCNGNMEIINEIISQEECLDELKVTLGSFYFLSAIVSDAKIYGNTVLCNIN